MNASHLFAGGGTGTVAAAVAAWALRKAGVAITTEDGIVIGGAALSLGTALAVRIERYGLRGLLTGLWKGSAPPVPPPPAA